MNDINKFQYIHIFADDSLSFKKPVSPIENKFHRHAVEFNLRHCIGENELTNIQIPVYNQTNNDTNFNRLVLENIKLQNF